MNWVDIMLIKAVLFYCISFLTSPAWTKNCSGKFITNDICIPKDYMKYELPTEEGATDVWIGVDIKDIPKVDDKDFSITLNAYFIAKWFDERLEISLRNRTSRQNKHQNRPNHHQYDGMFEKDKNVMNFEPKLSSTTSKVCSQT